MAEETDLFPQREICNKFRPQIYQRAVCAECFGRKEDHKGVTFDAEDSVEGEATNSRPTRHTTLSGEINPITSLEAKNSLTTAKSEGRVMFSKIKEDLAQVAESNFHEISHTFLRHKSPSNYLKKQPL